MPVSPTTSAPIAAGANPALLRRVLLIDAATCTASALLMVSGASALGRLMALPPALLTYAGLALVPVAAFIAFVATRRTITRSAVGLIVVGNALWVVGSLALLAGIVSPNALGVVFIAAQAAVVALLSWFEARALGPAGVSA